MEIVRAFGPLKAFHLETKVNSNERYAFIEVFFAPPCSYFKISFT